MTTFLDLVRSHGFETINDYLDAMREFSDQNDISASQLEKIKRNEAMTEEYMGGKAC
jgi:hypothetical protein